MTKRKAVIALIVLAMAALAVLGLAMVYRPSRQFDPRATTTPAEARSAAQAVEESLLRAGRLPASAARLERSNGEIEWQGIPGSAPEITAAKARSVRLTAGAPLLPSLLDDDPTYSATVEVEVVTADGQEAALTVALWDYGLLTPWSVRSSGDGWKPLQVGSDRDQRQEYVTGKVIAVEEGRITVATTYAGEVVWCVGTRRLYEEPQEIRREA